MIAKAYTMYIYHCLLCVNFDRIRRTNFDVVASARDKIFPRLYHSLRPYLEPDRFVRNSK